MKVTKYLGILFDQNLNWKAQIEQLMLKLRQGTGILNKLGYLIPPQCLKSLYYAFIQSHLQYCITAWGSPKTPTSKINNIVKKTVQKINKRLGINSNFNPLNFENIYKLESCKLIYSNVNNTIPESLKNLFELSSQHGRTARHSIKHSKVHK